MAAELTDEQCDALIAALCPDFDDDRYPRDRAVLRQLARDALATQQAAQGAEPALYRYWQPSIKRWGYTEDSSMGAPLYTAPPPTAEVEKKAARYDWLRNDATESEQDGWLIRLPEQADRYADERIAALTTAAKDGGR